MIASLGRYVIPVNVTFAKKYFQSPARSHSLKQKPYEVNSSNVLDKMNNDNIKRHNIINKRD